MRTTLDLPESLINEAKNISKLKTKTAVIKKALEEFIKRNKILELKKYQGKIELDIDLDRLRQR